MRNHPRPAALLAALLMFGGPAFAATTAASPEKPAPATPPKATLPEPEKPSANFPLSLQGFFGRGDTAEASLRLRDSGKSAWVKPGDSFGGWKLESVSTDTGRAILTSGSRRVLLHLAGESGGGAIAASTGRRYTRNSDSIILRRSSAAIRKHPGTLDELGAMQEQTAKALALARPDLVDPQTGEISWETPEGKRAAFEPETQKIFRDEARRFIQESTHPGIVAMRDGELAYIDAKERIPMRDDDGADMPASSPEQRQANKLMAYERRVLEEADRIYLSRGGNPDTSEYDQWWQEREARRKERAQKKPAAEAAK